MGSSAEPPAQDTDCQRTPKSALVPGAGSSTPAGKGRAVPAGKVRREGSLEAQLLGSFPSRGGPFPPDFLRGPQSAPFLAPALQLLRTETTVGNQTVTRMGS